MQILGYSGYILRTLDDIYQDTEEIYGDTRWRIIGYRGHVFWSLNDTHIPGYGGDILWTLDDIFQDIEEIYYWH